MAKRLREAAIAAFLSGILLLLADISGEGLWVLLAQVAGILVESRLLSLGFFVLISISSLGGIAVILGGLLFLAKRGSLGRAFVILGTGMGALGLLLTLALWALAGSPLTFRFVLGIAGVLLSLHARNIAKKK